MTTPTFSLDLRSYGRESQAHTHDFAQLVLPVAGALLMDIAGREGRLDLWHGAYVEDGASHSQTGDAGNRSLILDVDPAALDPAIVDRLMRRPFIALTPAANRLVDYMGMLMAGGSAGAYSVGLWAPLLMDTLAGQGARPQSRLAAVRAAIEADPGAKWTVDGMAARAGLSVSRLHALFREEMDTTPHAWLAALRIRQAQEWLARSDAAIAEIAYRGGYADQSTLTRALRKAIGMTPAAYRRHARETMSKESEF